MARDSCNVGPGGDGLSSAELRGKKGLAAGSPRGGEPNEPQGKNRLAHCEGHDLAETPGPTSPVPRRIFQF